jgi:hypothetical protein
MRGTVIDHRRGVAREKRAEGGVVSDKSRF